MHANHSRYLATTVAIVRAYVANNHIPARDVPDLLELVDNALQQFGEASSPASPLGGTERQNEAFVRASVRKDGIVSFINGRSYKTLKRHLVANGLSPERYRKRFGLPADYPMVASAYVQKRAQLAKGIRLNTGREGFGGIEFSANPGQRGQIASSITPS